MYSLLNSNCRINKPEDKYWHKCIWDHFQPQDTQTLFEYDIDRILDTIDNNTYYKHCSIEGWTYFSFVYSNPRESLHRIRRNQRKTDFFVFSNDDEFKDELDIDDGVTIKNKKASPYLVRGYHAKTTNHFGSIYIPHILRYSMLKQNMNLKFYVMFRNPMSRIISS